jgi:hypothetical protein
LKLGELQPVKPYKLLQEQVLESIFPLSLFKSPYNYIMFVMVYVIWGFGIFILYPAIPLDFFIAGSISAIGISFWSFGVIRYANRLRDTDIDEVNLTNKTLLLDFMERLFNNYSLFYGIILSTFGIAILTNPSFIKNDPYMLAIFNSFGNFQFILDYTERTTLIDYISLKINTVYLPLPILVYIYLLTFDMCYRIGVSIHITIQQMKRDYKLFSYLNNKELRREISPSNIKSLLNADKYHIIALAGGFFLLPLGYYDKFLFFFLLILLFLSFFFCILNLVFLDRLYVKAIPLEIKKILIQGKQGYISTVTSKKRPHITPCTYVFDGRHIFFTTSMKSQKIINLRKIKNIAFYIELRNPFKLTQSKSLLIQGRARIYGYNWFTSLIFVIFLGFKMLLIRNLFLRHFPNYIENYKRNLRHIPKAWRTMPIFSRTLVEIIPEKFQFSKGKTIFETEL